jgi:hypothetical protein
MDPNNNPPFGSPNPVPDPGQQPPLPAPINPATPDWQQGLGSPPPQQPLPPGAIDPSVPGIVVNQAPMGQPGRMPGSMPQSMPNAALPRNNWQQPSAPLPPAAPAPTQGPTLPPLGGDSMAPLPSNKKKAPRLLILIGIALIVLALLVVIYFRFLKPSITTNDAAKKSAAAAANADDMTKLAHVSVNVPETIAGYKARNTGDDSIKDFISDDGICEFITGTVSASELPGADLNAIIDPQVKNLKNDGATVKGPKAGNPLTIKEKDSSKTYAMPTIDFEFAKDKKHAIVHYSAVILSSNDRVIINRTCVNKDGTIDASQMIALDTVAQNVTITIKQ